ncbi:MAG: hypothetical protein ACTS8R_02835 [Arsenophonus sp. NC-QC1-MAG3]
MTAAEGKLREMTLSSHRIILIAMFFVNITSPIAVIWASIPGEYFFLKEIIAHARLQVSACSSGCPLMLFYYPS